MSFVVSFSASSSCAVSVVGGGVSVAGNALLEECSVCKHLFLEERMLCEQGVAMCEQ